MIKVLKNLISSSRLWLSAGVLCMFASILLGYHQNQMDAESALAQKISVPEPIVVQAFSSDVNENQLGEVRVLAEAAVDKGIRVDVGSEDTPRMVDVFPIYPVSRQSYPMAQSLTDVQRRPAPRTDAAAIAKHNSVLTQIENVPVGLVVVNVKLTSKPTELGPLELVQGLNGPLIDLTGMRIEDANVLERAADLFGQRGVTLIDDPLLVSPYLQGRNQASGLGNFVSLQIMLFWLSLLMIAIGMAALFSLLPSFKQPKVSKESNNVTAVGPLAAIDPFQPIAGQDEIRDEMQESRAGPTSRILTIASNVFRTRSRP